MCLAIIKKNKKTKKYTTTPRLTSDGSGGAAGDGLDVAERSGPAGGALAVELVGHLLTLRPVLAQALTAPVHETLQQAPHSSRSTCLSPTGTGATQLSVNMSIVYRGTGATQLSVNMSIVYRKQAPHSSWSTCLSPTENRRHTLLSYFRGPFPAGRPGDFCPRSPPLSGILGLSV